MMKNQWYLFVVVMLFVAGCAAPSSGSMTQQSQPIQQSVTVEQPTQAPCTGTALGPRNMFVVRDCPTELSGTEHIPPYRLRVDNRANRAVVITTNEGTFEVSAHGRMEIPNSGNSVGWSLK